MGEAETLSQTNPENGGQRHGHLGCGHLGSVSPGQGAQCEGANQPSQDEEARGQARLTLLVTQWTHELLCKSRRHSESGDTFNNQNPT